MDALDGLKALEQVVETISEELHNLYQSRHIPQIERVTLQTLEWTLAKLADDLHTMETEVKDLRLSVAAAQKLDLQRLGDMSRIAKERDELRAKAERKPWMEWHSRKVDKLHKRLPGNGILVHKLLVGDDLPELYEAGFRYLPITPEAELTKKSGELPAESYQWQVGDVVEHDDGSMNCIRPVTNRSEGWVFLLGDDSGLPQPEWERRGWKLYSKASALGVQQLTPRQVESSDSTGTDGEGQQ